LTLLEPVPAGLNSPNTDMYGWTFISDESEQALTASSDLSALKVQLNKTTGFQINEILSFYSRLNRMNILLLYSSDDYRNCEEESSDEQRE